LHFGAPTLKAQKSGRLRLVTGSRPTLVTLSVKDLRMERINLLTAGQRDCLRLVGEYLSSKEIARILDISPHTVDQRLKRATALLEVPTRFEAARLYKNHCSPTEGLDQDDPLYDPVVYQRSVQPATIRQLRCIARQDGSVG
jgi:DNA-binding CsgD family transcriptional regulator